MSVGGGGARIEILAVAGLATVQDGGRPGHMHEGVPAGGPMVPELHARANVAARNPAGDAAIELFGVVTLAARGGSLEVAGDDTAVRVLRDGESFTCRGSYLAVRGGVAVPRLLGGRGTLLVAGLGGHEGRGLRAGDVLAVGASETVEAAIPSAPDLDGPVRVVLGPDLDRFEAGAVDALLGAVFTITPQRDRVGIRLDGPAIPGRTDDAAPSSPMVRGAIQVPPSGGPIVLGPDHPTTGGYPVLATVASSHFGAFAARRPGSRVRFVTSA
jgi:allophanate hydrolase subunit 2